MKSPKNLGREDVRCLGRVPLCERTNQVPVWQKARSVLVKRHTLRTIASALGRAYDVCTFEREGHYASFS